MKLQGEVIHRLLAVQRKIFEKKFFKSPESVQSIQERVLLDKLKRNQDSEFGKKFDFSTIDSTRSFYSNLPLADYDAFEPYIDQVRAGNTRALFGSKEKCKMFALTSGTTGRAKYIPVTQTFLNEYREASLFWATRLSHEVPDLPRGPKVLPLISPLEEETTEHGIPCGSISGLIAKNQACGIRSLYAAPFEVSEFRCASERHYAFLRAALEHSVSVITTANPSTLLLFAKTLEENAEELLGDLAKGTLRGKKTKLGLRACPERSRGLSQLLAMRGTLRPRDVWPDLRILACWTGGTLFHYVKHLPPLYGDCKIKDIGLLASEGRFSLTVFPETDAGMLNIFHHFFEFIPEDEEDAQNPRTLLAHELTAGKRYFLVVTTSSGLYRYRLHDLVEVVDHYRNIPLIRFLNKGKHISSLTGEKLTEHQVLQAVQKVAQEHQVDLDHFRIFPRWKPTPHYLLMIESNSNQIEDSKKFADRLDAVLSEANLEYAGKRSSSRLGSLEFAWVEEGTFSEAQKKFHRPEQYKPVYLEPEPEAYLKFENKIKKIMTQGKNKVEFSQPMGKI